MPDADETPEPSIRFPHGFNRRSTFVVPFVIEADTPEEMSEAIRENVKAIWTHGIEEHGLEPALGEVGLRSLIAAGQTAQAALAEILSRRGRAN